MVLFPLAAAPGMMVAATAAERRYGAAVAGWVGAAPVSLAATVVGIGVESGDAAAATMALTAAGHVVAQVLFAIAFARALAFCGARASLACGVLAFAAASVLLLAVPTAIAVLAAVPALAVGPRLLGSIPPTRAVATIGPDRTRAAAIGVAASILLVGGSLLTDAAAGPVAAGTVGALPVQSAAFALLIGHHRGAAASTAALRGLICGLPGYLTFCLTLAATAPAIGVLPAAAGAVLACGVTSTMTLRGSRR